MREGRRCIRYQNVLWWLSLVTTMALVVQAELYRGPRCLPEQPDGSGEGTPKRHVMYKGDIYPFKIEMSQRITHQLVSEVFALFVQEVLGYADVELVIRKDNFNASERLQTLAYDTEMDFDRLPNAMANLELWVPPETNLFTLEVHEHFKETGIIAPPGRFGWFIPSKYSNIAPSMEYYTIFKSLKTAKIFNFTTEEISQLINKSNMRDVFDEMGRDNCIASPSDGSNCSEGFFTPPWCKDKPCALLLTGNPDETGFVIHHIKSLHLYVKVLWVGDRLEEVLLKIDQLISKSKTKRSYVLLTWTPSILTVPNDNRYMTISFPPCETYSLHTGCKYDLHRLVKITWQPLIEAAKPIHDSLIGVHFTREDYKDLLDRYSLRTEGNTVRQVACDWLKHNKNSWQRWFSPNDEENILHIGGIFPVSVPDYRGRGIIVAAEMAIEAINKNNLLLNGYSLNLLLADGKCQPDVVMKTFVDYVYLNRYNQLVGVLGPACSDTVEPLAGVSRYYKTVVISYSAEGSRFSDRNKYPYFFRTIGENHQYTDVYLQLLKKLQWNQVAALTQDGTKYAEYISSLQDLLHANKIMFIVNRKFPADRERDAMKKYLMEMKSKSARIIIADIHNGAARDTMCQAYNLGMTAKNGYVWFLPLWLSPDWYNTDKYNKNNRENISCTTKQMIEAINGHLGLTFAHYASDEKKMIDNKTVGEWKKEYTKKLSDRKVEPSDYGGYAYDAIWTLAFALDKLKRTDASFLSNIHNDTTIKHLVENIEQTDFNGVSGRVQFGKRSSRLSEVNIVQWLDNKTYIVGTFHPNASDPDGGVLNLNESLIKWLTPDSKKPVDGANQCIIQWFATAVDVPCDRAIIILNVVVFITLSLIMMLIFLFIKRRYDKKVQWTRRYWKSLGIDLLNPSNVGSLDKWEIPRDRVVINRKLGEGAFGFVYGGETYFNEKGWVAVAVKTLKVGSTTEEKLDFLSEAEVMKRFDHKNIVRLLGVCTKNEPVYTVMEFMLYGDMKTFLLGRRHLVNERIGEESEEVSSKKLTGMALDVARALSYLNELKYVHRDVASRNCLVNGARVVKLGDFGMTRPMFENDYYKFNRKGMLPVRWMAPESLGLGIFTPSSDVWSYGVLLYEIITFGSFPFQGMSNNQVLEHVKNGNTLKIPSKVKPQLEGLIRACWNSDSKKRPQASEIVEFLANNPRIITPCLDVPLSSVQLENTGQLQIQIPDKLRKLSMSLRNRSNNSISSLQRPAIWRNSSIDEENPSIWDQPPESPIETLPSISETWNNITNGGLSVPVNDTNNDNAINIWDNPVDSRLWNNDNTNSAAEPLLGTSYQNNNTDYSDDNHKYLALKTTGNNIKGTSTSHHNGYCVHDTSSNAQADSVL